MLADCALATTETTVYIYAAAAATPYKTKLDVIHMSSYYYI